MRFVRVDRQLEHHSLVGEEVQREFALVGRVAARLHRIRDVVHGFLQIEMHADVVFLHFVFAAEHKEVVAVLRHGVCDFVGQTGLVEVGVAATYVAEAVRIQRQTEDEA